MTGVDLADPGLFVGPDALDVLRTLQDQQPVYWNQRPTGTGFWVLTRYADAVSVYRMSKAFTSARGIEVGQAEASAFPGADKMMVMSDRDVHRRVKAATGKFLAPSNLVEPIVEARRIADSVVARAAGAGAVDLVTAIAGPIAMAAMGTLLGIPSSDREQVVMWTDRAFGAVTGPTIEPHGDDVRPNSDANAQIFLYFNDLLTARRRAPGRDLLSALAHTDQGAPLSTEEILLNVHLLLAGGYETTRQALVGCVAAFAEYPSEWRRLRHDGTLHTDAVEEVLRWSPPSLNVMRTATQDVEIAGIRIRDTERVTMWNPILNRDPDAFPDADRFDIGRTPNRHLTFGMGSHFCLGAALARAELSALLASLTARVRRIELVGSGRRMRSVRTWGWDYLPVRLIG